MRNKLLLLVCLLLAAIAAPAVHAQYAQTSQDTTKFYINLGAITDDALEYYWWQTGAMLDIPLGSNLLLTPEVMFIGYKFDFDELYLYPGATLNLKFGDKGNEFFVGAGCLLYWYLSNSNADNDLILKIHGGFIADNIKLTLYMYTFEGFYEGSGFFDEVYFGANIGFAL